MRVWRVCRKAFGKDAVAGRGGLVASGRWHSMGRPIVYTSRSLALAALEFLVHVDRGLVPADLVQVEIDIPDGLKIQRVRVAELPRDWRTYPAPPELQRRGDAWLLAGSTPVLEVPSAVIPDESNFLLNPRHGDAGKLETVSIRKFTYDARLVP